MSYHLAKIEKGVLGEFSKIREEFLELQDANEQENPILELVEISDLVGAIESYCSLKYNIDIYAILRMTRATERAFSSGRRK